MELLGYALRFECLLADHEGLEKFQRTSHQMIAGEHTAQTGQAFISLDRYQRVHAIVRLQLVAPAAFRSGTAQSRTSNRTNLHNTNASAATLMSRSDARIVELACGDVKAGHVVSIIS